MGILQEGKGSMRFDHGANGDTLSMCAEKYLQGDVEHEPRGGKCIRKSFRKSVRGGHNFVCIHPRLSNSPQSTKIEVEGTTGSNLSRVNFT